MPPLTRLNLLIYVGTHGNKWNLDSVPIRYETSLGNHAGLSALRRRRLKIKNLAELEMLAASELFFKFQSQRQNLVVGENMFKDFSNLGCLYVYLQAPDSRWLVANLVGWLILYNSEVI